MIRGCQCCDTIHAPRDSVSGLFEEQDVRLVFVEKPGKFSAHGSLYGIHSVPETAHSPIKQSVMPFEHHEAEA
jgi:hypothetical protein